jgi:hypothetical protein
MLLRAEFLEKIEKRDAYDTPIEQALLLADITKNASIGQLYQLLHMREDKLATLKFESVDADGIIYLTFCGMFGGMELDGSINT